MNVAGAVAILSASSLVWADNLEPIKVSGKVYRQPGGLSYIIVNDGMILAINGQATPTFEPPGPASEDVSPWTPASTITNITTGPVDLWAMDDAGNPNALQFRDTPAPDIPEPASI